MRGFIAKYYNKMKDVLQRENSNEIDIEELTSEVDEIIEQFYDEIEKNRNFTTDEYEFDGEGAVKGLFTKFRCLKGVITNSDNRNTESELAEYINLEWGISYQTPPCPYSEESFLGIQKKIIDFIKDCVREAVDEYSRPLISGSIKQQMSQKQYELITNNFIALSHSFGDYVEFYDKGNWNWQLDLEFIVLYVFDKAVELTYNVVKGNSTDELHYDIREAFSLYHLAVSEVLQEKIDGEIDKLHNIAIDIHSFIEKNNYHLCNKETWFRPVVFTIAVNGMRYVMEQDFFCIFAG